MAKKRNKNLQRATIAVVGIWLISLVVWYVHAKNFAILNPAGIVAYKERQLIWITVLLGLFVVVPVYVMTFAIAWRYREGNKKAKYSPNLAGNRLAETVWWGIPLIIIGILSVITWQSSHELDPRRPLGGTVKPLTIQVVALDWKWLFIYPEQGVASLNQVALPVGRPVHFMITADAPMNSFWIPQLGSQIYAMPGMVSQLNLRADKAGSYEGSSANISGRGFADMRFVAQASNPTEFDTWLASARHSPENLDISTYQQLVKPSVKNPVKFYSAVDDNLFQRVLLKYMAPGGA